jgi:hypothetical protein
MFFRILTLSTYTLPEEEEKDNIFFSFFSSPFLQETELSLKANMMKFIMEHYGSATSRQQGCRKPARIFQN